MKKLNAEKTIKLLLDLGIDVLIVEILQLKNDKEELLDENHTFLMGSMSKVNTVEEVTQHSTLIKDYEMLVTINEDSYTYKLDFTISELMDSLGIKEKENLKVLKIDK